MAEKEFAGKVALVTGGGSGIGAAAARLLASRGAQVLVADINQQAAEAVAAEFGDDGVAFTLDVNDAEACADMVALAVAKFGRLDVAVNNAGIGGPQAPVGDYPLDGWAQVIGINLSGQFYCMRAEIPAMIAAGGGSIVNVASILGSVGFAQSCAYVSAKHGLVGLTKVAALEYAAQGIRVNSVGPGFIDTPLLSALPGEMIAMLEQMHPIGRLGKADEVAETIAFLASDRASNTTGTYLLTDGGYTAQ